MDDVRPQLGPQGYPQTLLTPESFPSTLGWLGIETTELSTHPVPPNSPS